MRDQVEAVLAEIRPSLRMDGGDVQLLDVSESGVVRVALVGTCAGCPMSRTLIKCGLEQSLKKIASVTQVVTEDQRVKKL